MPHKEQCETEEFCHRFFIIIYTNDLTKEITKSKIGSKKDWLSNTLMHGDALVLLSPTVDGFQKKFNTTESNIHNCVWI